MNNRGDQSRGFSLIELLVVVAIIAALAAILIPVVSKGKARAARIACISNLKQMSAALPMYRSDWNGVMPYRMGYEKYSEDIGWSGRLKAYNDTVDLFRCPADTHFFSYGMNAQAMSKADFPEGRDSADDPFKESDVASPTRLIVIYEAPGSGGRQVGGVGDVDAGDSDLTNEDGQVDGKVYSYLPARNDNMPITSAAAMTHFNWLYFPGRHDGGNNLLFWDGHARWFRDWDWKQMTFDPSKKPEAFL
jgi:prepilin-type N-terminal cleavage/methylation domain-containing protein/prepilin-type processing-associated H-X9-DG protein